MKNNKILILGGTSGIGFQTAKRLSKDNEVIVVGRNENKGNLASVFGNIEFIKCDISKTKERKELVRKLEKYNIAKIIHCAGIFSQDRTKEYKKLYKEIKLGGIEIIKELLKTNNVSHVCAVGSLYTFLPENKDYSFEKQVHEKLENELMKIKAKEVFINCVAPGLVDTGLSREGFSKKFNQVLKDSPGSRVLNPEEVAESIFWLVNQSVISNMVIPIDGGYLRNFKK